MLSTIATFLVLPITEPALAANYLAIAIFEAGDIIRGPKDASETGLGAAPSERPNSMALSIYPAAL